MATLCHVTTPLLYATVSVDQTYRGWELRVDGNPYFVKGICYQPSRVGEDPGGGTLRDWMTVDDNRDGITDVAHQTWVDVNRNNVQEVSEVSVGDFALLQSMGCNTLRLYHHASSTSLATVSEMFPSPSQLSTPAPQKTLLRTLFASYGIRVAMGDLLGAYTVGSGAPWSTGTDYRDPVQRERMLRSVESMVLNHKNEPYVLMWILGNENNFSDKTHTNAGSFPAVYADFVNEAVALIRRLDPHHPICVSFGDMKDFRAVAGVNPAYDIVGINSYRTPGFGDLWKQVLKVFDRPVLLTEMGAGPVRVKNGRLDEQEQRRVHESAWRDIVAHAKGGTPPGNSLGGFVFEWSDNWWYDGTPDLQNGGPSPSSWNEEFMGITSQGDGKNSPLLRQLRPVYFMYKSLWGNLESEN